MAWLRRIGLLGLFLCVGPNLVTTSAVETSMDVTVTSDIPLTPPVKVGTAITFTVTVTGGAPPLQYQYWTYQPVIGWKVAQGYTTSNKFTFVPQQAGTNGVKVCVRSAGSTLACEGYPPADTYFTVGTVHIDGVNATPAIVGTVPLGQHIVFTPVASGGTPYVMYQYYVNEGSGWIYKGGYTSGALEYDATHPGLNVLRIYARHPSASGDPQDVSYVYFTVGAWPATAPLSLYVDTGATLDPTKTCSPGFVPRFTGAGLTPEVSKRQPGRIDYHWHRDANNQYDALYTEGEVLGFQPEYKSGRVSFATNGRPMIRDHSDELALQVLGDDGTWTGVSLFDAAKESLIRQHIDWQQDDPNSQTPVYFIGDFGAESRVVYDKDCNAYAIIDSVRGKMVDLVTGGEAHRSILMHSMDAGRHWAAYLIPELGAPWNSAWNSSYWDYTINMEVPTAGRHVLDGPPALLFHPRWYEDINGNRPPNEAEKARHVLKLLAPTVLANGTLSLGDPKLISDGSISGAGIAGSENYAVSIGDLIHIVYPGDTLGLGPGGTFGTPAWAVTYSRPLGGLTSMMPTGLGVGVNGTGPYVLDDHNQPVIARDSQDYLHVMIPGHNGPLYYRKSVSPNSTSNWTSPEPVGTPAPDGKYSYPSLIIDRTDTPFVVAREVISSGYYPVAMRRGTTWSEKILIQADRGGYNNWFHKLSLDPTGRVFMSYGYVMGSPERFYLDEVAVLHQKFGWTLVQDPHPVDPADLSCHPTASNDAHPVHCPYIGATDPVANLNVITADINQAWDDVKFEPATSGTFVGIGPRVWVDDTNAHPPVRSVVVSWSGIAEPSLTDWIGIFPVGASDSSSVISASATTSAGHVTLTFPNPGTYEVRLYQNSKPIAASRQFIAQ